MFKLGLTLRLTLGFGYEISISLGLLAYYITGYGMPIATLTLGHHIYHCQYIYLRQCLTLT